MVFFLVGPLTAYVLAVLCLWAPGCGAMCRSRRYRGPPAGARRSRGRVPGGFPTGAGLWAVSAVSSANEKSRAHLVRIGVFGATYLVPCVTLLAAHWCVEKKNNENKTRIPIECVTQLEMKVVITFENRIWMPFLYHGL